jgi:SRSO17 transposase
MDADQIRSLQPAMRAFVRDFRDCFKRESTFEHFQLYLLGLQSDVARKNIELIALVAGVAVRTLQEFLQFFKWDHRRVNAKLQQRVMDHYGTDQAIGVLDPSAHAKRGPKTPGVQWQWCGETGKVDNCVIGQHLLYYNNDAENPFTCVLGSDLYLPKVWADDREACRKAGIPDEVEYRPKWRIGIDLTREAIANGVRFAWLTFDEEMGSVPDFWFELDSMGQRAVGEVRPHFRAWVKKPARRSSQAAHASRRVDNLVHHSPTFTRQYWREMKLKDTTRGPVTWQIKKARVYLVTHEGSKAVPTDRQYWLIGASNPQTGEMKYFISNAPANASLEAMLQAAFSRWHIEKWFERAKQQAGFGAFEVRTYTSLIRHWLCSRLAMLFLAEQTHRLRGEKSEDYVRASGSGRRGDRMEDLATQLGRIRKPDRTVELLATPQ